MMDSIVQPSDSLVTGEGASFEELKTSKLATSKARRVKRSRDRSANIPKRPDFVLHGDKVSRQLPDYNGLKDEHLIGYFYNKKLRKILMKNGLLSRGGKVVEAKTCLNQTEVMKHTLNDTSVSFKSVRKGTLILGVQLPKLDPAAAKENKKTKRRSSSVVHSDYHSVEGTSRATPLDPKERLNMTETKFHETSTQDNSFSTNNVSLMDFYSAHVRGNSSQSTRRSSERTRKKSSSRVAPTAILKDLKPMTKEDLKAAIEKQKHKINETVIVDESPELLSGNSSQRIIEEYVPQTLNTEPSYRLDSRNKSRPQRDRVENTSKGFVKKESGKEKVVIKRTESLSPSPLNQERPFKPYQETRSIKIKTIKPLERNSYKEKTSPAEKDMKTGVNTSIDYVKTVDSPAKRGKSRGESPSSKGSMMRSQQIKEEINIVEKIEEGSQSPTQRDAQPVKKASYDTNRSPRRESSVRQSGVRPSSRAQEDRSSKRKDTDPMNRDLVRQNTNEQEMLDQVQQEPVNTSKSPRKEQTANPVNTVNRARTIRPSTSSNAQENRNLRRKNTAGQEKELVGQSMQIQPTGDDSKKRVASAGGDPPKEEKKRFKMKIPSGNPYDIPTQSGKGQKEVAQANQSPTQKTVQEIKVQEGTSAQIDSKRSSKGQLQHSISLSKSQREEKKLRTSASGNNNSPTQSKGKLNRTNTIEVKQQIEPKNTIEESQTVAESPQQGSPPAKERSISDITAALFGTALHMAQPLDKSLLQRIKEAFRQRSLTPDSAQKRQNSESPQKDNKNAQKA